MVHGEGDAQRDDVDLRKGLSLLELLDVKRSQPLDQRGRRRARIAMGIDQLVPQKRERAQVGHWSKHAT